MKNVIEIYDGKTYTVKPYVSGRKTQLTNAERLVSNLGKCEVFYSTEKDGRIVARGYIGRRQKSEFFTRYVSMHQFETQMFNWFGNNQKWEVQNIERKEAKKAQIKALKAEIKPDTLVHTSFSYNMTFNNFYVITHVSGNTVTLYEVQKEWVSGDAGYTGNVSATKEAYGAPFNAKITARGLVIKDQTAKICTYEDTFYENHMD